MACEVVSLLETRPRNMGSRLQPPPAMHAAKC